MTYLLLRSRLLLCGGSGLLGGDLLFLGRLLSLGADLVTVFHLESRRVQYEQQKLVRKAEDSEAWPLLATGAVNNSCLDPVNK